MNKDTKVENLLPFHSERILVAIWPASGIGLVALSLSQHRLWFVILAAFFLVGNISNLMIDRLLFNSMGFMIANVIESLKKTIAALEKKINEIKNPG